LVSMRDECRLRHELAGLCRISDRGLHPLDVPTADIVRLGEPGLKRPLATGETLATDLVSLEPSDGEAGKGIRMVVEFHLVAPNRYVDPSAGSWQMTFVIENGKVISAS